MPGAFEEFSGTDRFTIQRRVGRGGMGIVYEAFDKERGSRVALKTLSGFESASVYRIKREFRALADLGHTNLVAYHELVSAGDTWFFTMELVDGVDFLTAVSAPPDALPNSDVSGSLPRSDGSSRDSSLEPTAPPLPRVTLPRAPVLSVPSDSPTRALETMLAPLGPESITARAEPARAGAPLKFSPEKTLAWWSLTGKPAVRCPDQPRLKRLLRQLFAGVDALHRVGTVHRDIKPSNVLVDRRGRVVVLDFGLAAEAANDAQREQVIQGTPEYMAPEQAHGAAGPAADLYAIGVMLFEALVGFVPFVGGVFDILNAKQTVEPPLPSSLVEGVDPELDALCGSLLRRVPEERPTLARVIELLGADEPLELGARGRTAFIGRDAELDTLHAAAREAYVGRPVVITVSGISGMGKSALMRRFLDELKDGVGVGTPGEEGHHRPAVVLKGRCYERESVPYKAVDALMDALSRLLLKDAALAEAVLPADAQALARLFPVFLDVPAFKNKDEGEVADPQILRRRGFAALRELVVKLAKRVALVLYIDDLQWGDADSAALLMDLLRPPEPPPVLLVCAFRSDEAEGSPFIADLFNPTGEIRTGLSVHDIQLGPLDELQSKRLASNYLRDVEEELLAAIAREAEGSPFFVTELSRATLRRARDGNPSIPSLDKVIGDRVAELAPTARTLLEIIAVAAEPIRQHDAVVAAGLSTDPASDWASLRAEHMLRTRGARSSDLAEAYHDRIREAVVASLPAARLASHHLALGLALEQGGHAEVEALARHFREGKDTARARTYTLAAAEKATKALAFVRAAHLYREALELDRNAEDAWLVEKNVADALCNGGRGGEAWKVYRSAARSAPRADALDLERLAAEHACRTGHIDDGLALFRDVTRAHGIRMSTSPAEALVSLLARRALVRVRGLSFKERAATDVPREELQKLDVCYSLAVGLGFIDPIQGADFQSRMLVEALGVGEPYRVVLGMAVEALFSATGGRPAEARTNRLIETAERLAQRVNHPHGLGNVEAARAFSAIFVGRWRAGYQHAQRAETIFRTQCTNVAHEIASAQIFGLWALFHLGRFEELATFYPEHVRVHEEQGDLFAAGSKRTLIGHIYHLMRDDPKGSKVCIDKGMRGWSKKGFHVQHWYELKARVHTDFYEDDAELAYSHISDAWGPLQRSLLSRVISIRGDSLFLRARALLFIVHKRRSKRGLLKEVEKIAKELLSDFDVLNTPGWGHALLAGVHTLNGDRSKAIEAMERALATFERVDMVTFSIGGRYRLGQLLGGAKGQRMIEQAREELASRGVEAPERFVNMLLPNVYG